MKLIEAEKVERITWQEPIYSDPLNVLTEVREKVRALPEVEAIPISWLQAKADSWNAELKTACPEDAETIRHIQQKYLGIIEEWRKEK